MSDQRPRLNLGLAFASPAFQLSFASPPPAIDNVFKACFGARAFELLRSCHPTFVVDEINSWLNNNISSHLPLIHKPADHPDTKFFILRYSFGQDLMAHLLWKFDSTRQKTFWELLMVKLPQEVRKMILEELFVHEYPIVAGEAYNLSSQLLRVSKSFYQQGIRVLYYKNSFHVRPISVQGQQNHGYKAPLQFFRSLTTFTRDRLILCISIHLTDLGLKYYENPDVLQLLELLNRSQWYQKVSLWFDGRGKINSMSKAIQLFARLDGTSAHNFHLQSHDIDRPEKRLNKPQLGLTVTEETLDLIGKSKNPHPRIIKGPPMASDYEHWQIPEWYIANLQRLAIKPRVARPDLIPAFPAPVDLSAYYKDFNTEIFELLSTPFLPQYSGWLNLTPLEMQRHQAAEYEYDALVKESLCMTFDQLQATSSPRSTFGRVVELVKKAKARESKRT